MYRFFWGSVYINYRIASNPGSVYIPDLGKTSGDAMYDIGYNK